MLAALQKFKWRSPSFLKPLHCHHRSMSDLRQRPAFPSEWSSIPLNAWNLLLANTLPVGQSFLWHRHPLGLATPLSSPGHDLASPFVPNARNSIASSSRIKLEFPPSSVQEDDTSGIVEEFSRAVHSPPRVVLLRQSPTHLYYTAVHPDPADDRRDREEGWTRTWLLDYFQLEKYPDLGELYRGWRDRDPGLFGKLDLGLDADGRQDEEQKPVGSGGGRAKGVRVLRQDPWECLIAFITSTNNHIPRIAGLMHRLSTHFSPTLLTLAPPHYPSIPEPLPSAFPLDPNPTSERLGGSSIPEQPTPTTYRLFPDPHLLPTELEPTLRDLGFGYRAGFIESSLASLRAEFGDQPGDVESGLDGWRAAELEVVREKLVGLKGVGRKVADCVMLMCLDQPRLIPIDIHLSHIAARHPSFPSRLKNKPMSKALYDEVQQFLEGKWGSMGGWAQAVMFAAELKESTIKNATSITPKKAKVTTKAQIGVKLEALKVEVDDSPDSTVLQTPGSERSAWIAESPLGSKAARLDRGIDRPSLKSTNSGIKGKGKRKAVDPENIPVPNETFLLQADVGEESKPVRGGPAGLPASYGFKRTRSAARVELQRKSSGISILAEDVGDLAV